jgi:hypothetical protein
VHHYVTQMLFGRDLYVAPMSKTVTLVRSLEDSLAHWCTIQSCDTSSSTDVAGHQ